MKRRLVVTVEIDTEMPEGENRRDTLRRVRQRVQQMEWALRDEFHRPWFAWVKEDRTEYPRQDTLSDRPEETS